MAAPGVFERRPALRFGPRAVGGVHGDFATGAAPRGADIVRVPIFEATARLKPVDPALHEGVGVFSG